MDGARLASWELRQANLEHTVSTDSSVAWLLAREAIDVVLLGAEWVAANGDCAGVIGSRAVAQHAACGGALSIRDAERRTSWSVRPSPRGGSGERGRWAHPASSCARPATSWPTSPASPSDRRRPCASHRRHPGHDHRRPGDRAPASWPPPLTSAIESLALADGSGSLMASVTRSSLAAARHLEVRATRDRDLLLSFLDQDRLFAAYAIARPG